MGGMSDVATAQTFGGMIRFDEAGQIFRIFFLITSVFVIWEWLVSTEGASPDRIFPHLAGCNSGLDAAGPGEPLRNALRENFKAATVGFYILVSYFRDAVALEAGLKYLIMGALSSAILLFGIVLLYGAGSNPALMGSSTDPMNFGNLTRFLSPIQRIL